MSPQGFQTDEKFPMHPGIVEHIAEVYALGEDDGSSGYVYRYTIQRLCASHASLRDCAITPDAVNRICGALYHGEPIDDADLNSALDWAQRTMEDRETEHPRHFALREVDDWASRRQNVVVHGEKLEGAITAHYRYLLNCIGNERRKADPDRGLIEVLSDAVRFTREHVYLIRKYLFSNEDGDQ